MKKRYCLCMLCCILVGRVIGQPVYREMPEAPAVVADFTTLPKLKWQFKIDAQIFSSPVASKGIVYFGGLDSTLYAIDLNTGKPVWKFRTKGEIRSTVCMDGDNVLLNGGDGILYALNKTSGQMIWKFETVGEKKYDFADYFQSTPVVDSGVVYVGSGDYTMYALNAQTGAPVWTYATGNIIHNKAVVVNGNIYFGSFDGYVYALHAADGKLVWKFKTVGHRYFPKGEVQGSPCAYNNMIFVGARDYNLYALNQQQGYCHWNKAFARGWALNPNVYDSVLYIGSADERVLIAADAQTGNEQWKKKMEFLVFGNNAYTDSMLYVGTTIGKLHGINMLTGEKVWSYATDSYLNNRSSYFKPDDSYRDDIYSIIKSNEHFLEVECRLGGIFTTPLIANNCILFTSTNGTLYCLKR